MLCLVRSLSKLFIIVMLEEALSTDIVRILNEAQIDVGSKLRICSMVQLDAVTPSISQVQQVPRICRSIVASCNDQRWITRLTAGCSVGLQKY